MAALRRSAALFRHLTSLNTRTLATTTTATTTSTQAGAAQEASTQKRAGAEAGLGTVRDVLKTKGEKYYYTRGDALVYDAVKEMVKHNIGSLIIVEGPRRRPVGIVTETDYLNKVIVRGRSSKTTLVRDIMSTKQFTYVSPGATLHDCMELMTERRIRHIPVVEEGTDKLLGMVSVGDIVSELVAAHRRTEEHMRSFIQGSY